MIGYSCRNRFVYSSQFLRRRLFCFKLFFQLIFDYFLKERRIKGIKSKNDFSAMKSFSVSAWGIRLQTSNSHNRAKRFLREPGFVFLSLKDLTNEIDFHRYFFGFDMTVNVWSSIDLHRTWQFHTLQ